MLIQSYTLQTSWCEYWVGFVLELSLCEGSYTGWLQVRGSDTNGATCTLLTSRLWRTDSPPRPPRWELSTATPQWTGIDDRTGRDAQATEPRGGCERVSGHSPGLRGEAVAGKVWRGPLSQSDGTELRQRLTDYTHELAMWVEQHILGLGLGCSGPPGTARRAQRLRAWPTSSARASLWAVLIQWAAKVAFFKLKLDQLIDSLCRVCLAESKQNLKDKKNHNHRGVSLQLASSRGLGAGLTPCRTAVPESPTFRTLAGAQMSSGALCYPSQLALQGVARGKFLVSPVEKLGLGGPSQALLPPLPVLFNVLSPGEAGQSSPSHIFTHGCEWKREFLWGHR